LKVDVNGNAQHSKTEIANTMWGSNGE